MRPPTSTTSTATPTGRIFGEELPRAMNALRTDRSPAAVANAAVTYTMIVEGVLAETGYHGYFTALERAGLLTGLREGLALVKRDESRHIAYGVYLISRLVQDDPGLWPASRGADGGAPAGRALGRRRDVRALRSDAVRSRPRRVHRVRDRPVREADRPNRAGAGRRAAGARRRSGAGPIVTKLGRTAH